MRGLSFRSALFFYVMRPAFLTILLTLISLTISSSQSSTDLRISWSGTSVLEVDYEPTIWTHDLVSSGGAKYQRFDFREARTDPSKPGDLMIPYRSALITFPSKVFAVTVVDTEYTMTGNVSLAGYPGLEPDEQFGAAAVFGAASLPLSHELVPGVLSDVADVAESKDGFVGTLKLYPVHYDPVRRAARLYSRIRLRFVFTGGAQSQRIRKQGTVVGSPPVQGEFYKMDVQESGIYKLDQSFFTRAGIPVASVAAINSIKVYGNGGGELPENLASPRPNGLQEIARHAVDKDGDGNFDPEDFILFYGRSPRSWKYNPSTQTYSHELNSFTETNHYFLSFGGQSGKGMDSLQSLVQTGAYKPSSFQGRVFLEEERNNLINSGRQWVGQLLNVESKVFISTTLLPGYDPQAPVVYRFVVLGRSTSNQTFRIDENGQLLGQITTLGFNTSSIENNYAYRSPVASFSRSTPLPGGRSVLRIEFQAATAGPEGWIDWIEILYRQSFDAINDQLSFNSHDSTAVVEYGLHNFSPGDVFVFDVTDHGNVKRITNLNFDTANPGRFSFRLSETNGAKRELFAVGQSGFKVPTNMRRVDQTNLSGITGGADFVIVTPKEFTAEAGRLKAHREQRDSLTTLVASVEDIFNEFSGGLPDPMAVRDFLVRAQGWQKVPRYVLLLGNGHYDYKNIRTSVRNWIPAYESVESIHQIDSYASDDHFAFLNAGNVRVSLGIGRIPVTSPEEARVAVDRIISYETASTFSPWRNRVTYVADDGLTSTRDEGNIHTYQAELLAQSYTPASVERKKIYIIEYPTVNSSSGRRKPAANTAIVDAINNGTLIVNYTGHGNPQLWAHEAIFTRETSLPQLTNAAMLTFVVAATCDFARYDNPAERSAGEVIMFLDRGGAIGVVTASRAVYSFENSQFNNTLYIELFRRDPDGKPPRLGDAMYRTKQIHYSTNDVKYHLFGDPTMRLSLPRTVAAVDSINGNSVGSVVTVQTLGLMNVLGEVRRPDGSRWSDFNGRAFLEVFDSKRRVYVPEWSNYSFEINGSLLYRGEISVRNGLLSATIPIPKDVSYDSARARISMYAWNNQSDAVGFTDQLVIAGTDTGAVADAEGPVVEVYLENESFRSGDIVSPSPLLLVKLGDQSGINTSSASIGHRLEAILGENQQAIDLTDFYRSDLDTYRSGEVRFPMKTLPEGRHTLSVKAWDIHNNSSQTEIAFEVRAVSAVSLHNVFNFPNPVSRSTVFTFQRSSGEPIDVEVKIYTLTGRLIGILRTSSVVDRFVQVPWDGKDSNGDDVANGVYFYKVIAKSSSGSTSSEALGRLSVLR